MTMRINRPWTSKIGWQSGERRSMLLRAVKTVRNASQSRSCVTLCIYLRSLPLATLCALQRMETYMRPISQNISKLQSFQSTSFARHRASRKTANPTRQRCLPPHLHHHQQTRSSFPSILGLPVQAAYRLPSPTFPSYPRPSHWSTRQRRYMSN
jgi:hypothetical protein